MMRHRVDECIGDLAPNSGRCGTAWAIRNKRRGTITSSQSKDMRAVGAMNQQSTRRFDYQISLERVYRSH